METTQHYNIHIQNVGLVTVCAFSKWHALELAYTQYSNVQPEKKCYCIILKTIRNNEITSKNTYGR